MKLQKAVEKLQQESELWNTTLLDPDLDEAIKLGIEALKRIMIVREMHTAYWSPTLPGETKD